MNHYRGRALHAAERSPRAVLALRGVRIAAALIGLAALAFVPWRALRTRYAVLSGVRVKGLRYLEPSRIRRDAALVDGRDLLSIDLVRVRQLVMADPRVERADVHRSGLRGLELRVTERQPMLVVAHGEPWEIDSAGVLLEPLQPGVVADVPLLIGPDFSALRPGAQVRTPAVQRGLAWAAILSDNALRLVGEVSEIDVSESRMTRLVLMNGTRVIGPAWPAGLRQLSGLRATLLDLEKKGMLPGEVDVRVPDQIIVRDARPAQPAADANPRTS